VWILDSEIFGQDKHRGFERCNKADQNHALKDGPDGWVEDSERKKPWDNLGYDDEHLLGYRSLVAWYFQRLDTQFIPLEGSFLDCEFDVHTDGHCQHIGEEVVAVWTFEKPFV